ncbi:hypothetical protein L3C95_21635 [Chitinophaga filiformis]|uniref:hypothetical protein n=1 Tax=Chitinophaga filiformis TaxID=104663 RepID=UPI001F2E8659|nr:hypothetical protein [Chitinophaga filiformis]MCF6405521.1 hypothetical protein [Chitinophaga filiformis]
MKVVIPVFIVAFLCLNVSKAQDKYSIGFDKVKDTVLRSNTGASFISLQIKVGNIGEAFKDYIVNVAVERASTIRQDDFEVIDPISGTSLNAMMKNKNVFTIKLNPSDPNYIQVEPLKLILKLSVRKKKDDKEDVDSEDNNESGATSIELIVLPPNKLLTDYRFLGYLGTNFDLVDGVKAQNLFFATNIFIAETKKMGISLGVYGNRTMTSTDSARDITFTSRIVTIDTGRAAYYKDSAMKVVSKVSDNIGAYITPLFRLNFFKEGDLKLYYAPQFEFIWRRTVRETSYLNNHNYDIDTITKRFPPGTAFSLVTPLRNKVKLNIYDAYLGLAGLLLRYETEDISIRVSSSVGININYTPISFLSANGEIEMVNQVYKKDTRGFFFTRMWITEPKTGLTMGAEVSNYFGYTKSEPKVSKAQPYYNVTLSKAFFLKDLAPVVKPLSGR